MPCKLIIWVLHKLKVKVKLLSRVRLFGTPWTVAYHNPLSMGFSRQEYWSGLPFTVDFFKAFFPIKKVLLLVCEYFLKSHESVGFYWVFCLHLLHLLKCSLNMFPLIWWIVMVALTDFSGVEPCQYYCVKPTCFQWIFIYILKLVDIWLLHICS